MSGNNIETIMRKYLLFFMLLVSICAHAQQREDYDAFQKHCWGARGLECGDHCHQVWCVVQGSRSSGKEHQFDE